jgi:hypothetical protein
MFAELSAQVEELRESLEQLHRKLVSRRFDTGPSRRSLLRWTGPYRVLECMSDWEFVIQHLVTNEKFSAHCSRLKYYCDKDLNVTADLKFQITHDEMRYRVAKILKHRVVEGSYEFLTQWEGFDEEDSTWEPVTTLLEDVQSICQQYVLSISDKDKLKPILVKMTGLK